MDGTQGTVLASTREREIEKRDNEGRRERDERLWTAEDHVILGTTLRRAPGRGGCRPISGQRSPLG